MVDHTALTFGSTRQEHFLNNFRQRRGGGFHRAGKRIAAEGAEAHHALFDTRFFLIGEVLEDALVVDHDQSTVLLDDFAFGGEVQRHDWNLFQIDVLPDVQLGPIRQREDADGFALLHFAVIDIPQFGALILRVPAMLAVAEGIDTLLRPRFFFVAACATKGGIEAMLVERLLETLGLHDVGVLGTAVGEGVDALSHTVRVDVSDQVEVHLGDHLFAETVHFLEFPASVDVHDRKWQAAGEKRLTCQMQHHGGVFADGIEHHRIIELGGHLTNDVDAFRLQLFQMRQFIDHSYSRIGRWTAAGRNEGATLARR